VSKLGFSGTSLPSTGFSSFSGAQSPCLLGTLKLETRTLNFDITRSAQNGWIAWIDADLGQPVFQAIHENLADLDFKSLPDCGVKLFARHGYE
jgi:hypothetical protein